MMKYIARRGAYDLARATVRASIAQQKATNNLMAKIGPGTQVWWRHSSGYPVPAEVVDISDNYTKVRLKLVRNGRLEMKWVSASTLLGIQ